MGWDEKQSEKWNKRTGLRTALLGGLAEQKGYSLVVFL